VFTTGAISRVKLQSNHHHQQTNIQFFTDRMSLLSPNQQCQSTEGKISHSMDLLTPSSPWVFQLCLWPLISPGYLGEGCHASHQPSDASITGWYVAVCCTLYPIDSCLFTFSAFTFSRCCLSSSMKMYEQRNFCWAPAGRLQSVVRLAKATLRVVVSEMTYTVSSGTLNSTIPYHATPNPL